MEGSSRVNRPVTPVEQLKSSQVSSSNGSRSSASPSSRAPSKPLAHAAHTAAHTAAAASSQQPTSTLPTPPQPTPPQPTPPHHNHQFTGERIKAFSTYNVIFSVLHNKLKCLIHGEKDAWEVGVFLEPL